VKLKKKISFNLKLTYNNGRLIQQRVRDRMHEMINLIAFDGGAKDKKK